MSMSILCLECICSGVIPSWSSYTEARLLQAMSYVILMVSDTQCININGEDSSAQHDFLRLMLVSLPTRQTPTVSV